MRSQERFLSTTKFGLPDRLYRPDIDGIRALAILSVVLYHADVPLVTGGFTGVDIFFVISGYLIGGHILSELQAGAFSYLRFYQRRAKRILPALYGILTFTLLAALVLMSPLEAQLTGRSAFAATLSASNILFWRIGGYFAPAHMFNTLLMTWSLGVEEQFYAVIPFLLVVLTRIRRKSLMPAILFICALSFLFSILLASKSPRAVFFLLPSRAWELGAGVALAAIELKGNRRPLSAPVSQCLSLVGLALMLVPMFLLSDWTPFLGTPILPSVLGSFLVIATPGSWINRRLLSLPPIVFVGRVSYSWYLWHWPVLAFLHILYGGKLPLAVALLAIASTFGIAVLSYYFIEQPFRRSARAPVPLLARYAIVSVVMLAACGVLWRSHGLEARYPQLWRTEAASLALTFDPCIVPDGNPNLAKSCYDSSSRQPSVALWGDSHSTQLAPGLRSAASEQGYGLVQLAMDSCLPLIGAVYYIPPSPQFAPECERFNRKVIDMLEADRSVRVVILAGAWFAPFTENWKTGWLAPNASYGNQVPTMDAQRSLFIQSLRATIQSLQASGKQVLVFQDTPHFDFNPAWRVRTAQISARRNLALWLGIPNASDPGFAPPGNDPAVLLSSDAVRQALASLPRATLVDINPMLCQAPRQCTYRIGEKLLYLDDNHLAPDGARFALREFRFPALIEAGNDPAL